MSELIHKIRDWANLGVVPAIGLLIFTSFLIFLPDLAMEKLGLESLFQEYQILIGLLFLFSLAFLVAHSLSALWKVFLGTWLHEQASLFFLKKEAKDLTLEEKLIIRRFIKSKTRSMNLSVKDAVVLGLEKRRFIIRTGNIGTDAISMTFPYAIQPWAWEHFNRNPGLLD